jgi:anti-sigma-K factor RskA
MNRDHATIDELLAARALDGLDPDETDRLERAMAEHGDCDTCRRLEAEHRETAAMLSYAIEPRPVDPAIADRILREPGPPAVPVRDRRVRRWQGAFGVAAAVAATLAVVVLVGPGDRGVVPADRFVTFQGGEGELVAAFAPGSDGLVVWGSDLPDPGAGKVYELWLIDDGQPTRGACLAPRDGSVGAFVPADVRDADVLAVTVEAASCPDAPTTDPAYTATIS